jgi:hypothetical protein
MLSDFGKLEDGMWVLPDGTSCEDKDDVLSSFLGFCGCGCPEETFKYIASALELIRDNTDWDTRHAKLCELCGGKQAADFMLYFLDSKRMTEHGTSIGGSWIDEKGTQFIEAVKELPEC